MKKIIALLLLLAISLTACGRRTPAPLGADAPADNVPNIQGNYALNATDPSGEQYGGTLSISTGDQPNEYKLQWLISGGVHEGTGTLEGNTLKVIWHSVSGDFESLSGTASYTVTVNGELHGERFIDGVKDPGQETAYPNPNQ